MSEVTTRVPGWIETLYVDSTGKLVHKGEPLFDFYSPGPVFDAKGISPGLDPGR